ncbi:MAG: histidinol-phosphatase [Clostridiaceae bacterium]|jgi:histidinol-phosphatase (PHP family)|nr:histidinol-phosphatase [Clostridiaceae bacterium]
MIKSTFHSHSRFDDGCDELEAYLISAIAKGFKVFGFSAHAPVIFESDWNMKLGFFDEYIQTTELLKEKYSGIIEIYTGLETDYYPGCIDWRVKNGVDYTIGAIHFIKNDATGVYMPLDGNREEFEETLKNGFDNDICSLVKAYYGQIREMLMKMPPNIIAHLDVIKKNNINGRYFDEEDDYYREEVLKTLEIISLSNTIVEVNTGGIARGYMLEPYPSKWILEACLDMDIPVMVNSDSHHPDNIDFYYEEIHKLLKKIGYKYQRILSGNKWRNVKL